jgi:hypothetical protein
MENEKQTEGQPEQQFKNRHRGKPPDTGGWMWQMRSAVDYAGLKQGTAGVAVYTALCHLESSTPSKHKGNFRASFAEISAISRLSERKVKEVIDGLCDARLIERSSGRNQGKLTFANQYRLTPTKSDSVSQKCKNETKTLGTGCTAQGIRDTSQVHTLEDSFPFVPTAQGGRKERSKNTKEIPSAEPTETHLAPKGAKGFEGSAENEDPALPCGFVGVPIVRRVKTWEELEYAEWLHKQRSQPRAQDGDSGSFTEAEGHDSGEGH